MKSLRTSGGRSTALRYGAAVGCVAWALLMRMAIDPYLHNQLPYVTFFVAVTVAAWFGGLGPALLSTALGFLAAEWFFVGLAHASWTNISMVNAVAYFLVTLPIAVFSHTLHKAREQAVARQEELEREIGERSKAEEELRNAYAELGRQTAGTMAVMHALEREKQRFEEVLSHLPVCVALFTPDHHVAFANRMFRERFGQPEGRRCFECIFGRAAPCEFCESYRVLETMEPHTWEFAGLDGSLYQAFAFPFTDTDGSTLILDVEVDITDRKRAEESLQKANCQLRQLSSDLLRSQDYERRRIARELHDSTAQLLAALSINLSRLRGSELEPDLRSQVLSEAIDLAAACSAEIRTVTYLLHPPLLDEVGLTAALQAYAQGFNQRTGIQVEIEIPPDFGRLGNDMETTLFRIVQEGLANVHKHSGSRLAVIRLQRDAREVRLVLDDRGRGLPEASYTQAKGFVRFGVGIMGMRERAEQLGGRLELSSNDAGARLTVTLPMVHSNEENASIVGR
jgi:signal transduction histidine kinase